MKFNCLTGQVSDSSALAAEYKAARPVGALRLGTENMFFRKTTKIYYVPYTDISRCFRRVQLVPAKLCCGKGDFAVENLVICGVEGEIAQIQLPGTHAAKVILEDLKEIIPHAQFGKPQE